jgi:hypothetical protein
LLEQLLLQELLLVGSEAALACCATLQLHLVEPAQQLSLTVVGLSCCSLVEQHLLVGSSTNQVLETVLGPCALQPCSGELLLLEQLLLLLLQLVLAQLLLNLLLLLERGLLLLLLLELCQSKLLLLLLLLLQLLLLAQLNLQGLLSLLLLLGRLLRPRLLQLLQLLELQRLHVVATKAQRAGVDPSQTGLCKLALHTAIGHLLEALLACKLLHALHAGTCTQIDQASVVGLGHETCSLLLHASHHQIIHAHRSLNQPIGHPTSVWLLQEASSSRVGHTPKSIQARVGVHERRWTAQKSPRMPAQGKRQHSRGSAAGTSSKPASAHHIAPKNSLQMDAEHVSSRNSNCQHQQDTPPAKRGQYAHILDETRAEAFRSAGLGWVALTLLKRTAITDHLHQASQAWASPPKETSAAARSSNSNIQAMRKV